MVAWVRVRVRVRVGVRVSVSVRVRVRVHHHHCYSVLTWQQLVRGRVAEGHDEVVDAW